MKRSESRARDIHLISMNTNEFCRRVLLSCVVILFSHRNIFYVSSKHVSNGSEIFWTHLTDLVFAPELKMTSYDKGEEDFVSDS